MTRRCGRGVDPVLIAEAERLWRASARDAGRRLAAVNAAAGEERIPAREVGELVADVWGLPARRRGRQP
ncbi:MAG: hypothetical protein ACYDCL_13710 [Myxococcales bacterium]